MQATGALPAPSPPGLPVHGQDESGGAAMGLGGDAMSTCAEQQHRPGWENPEVEAILADMIRRREEKLASGEISLPTPGVRKPAPPERNRITRVEDDAVVESFETQLPCGKWMRHTYVKALRPLEPERSDELVFGPGGPKPPRRALVPKPLRRPAPSRAVRPVARARGAGRPAARRRATTSRDDGADSDSDGPGPAGLSVHIAGAASPESHAALAEHSPAGSRLRLSSADWRAPTPSTWTKRARASGRALTGRFAGAAAGTRASGRAAAAGDGCYLSTGCRKLSGAAVPATEDRGR
jgi:hypothetical protein